MNALARRLGFTQEVQLVKSNRGAKPDLFIGSCGLCGAP